MQSNKDPESLENQPEQETEATDTPTFNCDSFCRYVDGNGLVCGVCLKKILDDQAAQRSCKNFLLAACFEGSGMALLWDKRAVMV